MATSDSLLPTPAVSDCFTGNLKSSQQNPNSKHSVNLPQVFDHPYYSQEASPASLSAKPDEGEARRTTATSGRKCYELYESFLPYGSSLKTCVASLLKGAGWYSNKCALTWKTQATRYNRLLFLLSPSTHRTEGIGSGLLPTAQAIDGNGEGRVLRLKKDCNRDPNQPGSWRGDLKDHIKMIPTPNARDGRGAAVKTRDDMDSLIDMGSTNGGTGTPTGLKLQPNFVAWMMGYPLNWANLNSPSPDTEKSS